MREIIEIIHRPPLVPENYLIPRRVYGKTEQIYLNHFLFHPESIVKTAVAEAVKGEQVSNDYLDQCHYAEDMGTVFDFARSPVLKKSDRGELYVEEIDSTRVSEATGMTCERVEAVKNSLVGVGLIRSKNKLPQQWGGGRKR